MYSLSQRYRGIDCPIGFAMNMHAAKGTNMSMQAVHAVPWYSSTESDELGVEKPQPVVQWRQEVS